MTIPFSNFPDPQENSIKHQAIENKAMLAGAQAASAAAAAAAAAATATTAAADAQGLTMRD